MTSGWKAQARARESPRAEERDAPRSQVLSFFGEGIPGRDNGPDAKPAAGCDAMQAGDRTPVFLGRLPLSLSRGLDDIRFSLPVSVALQR